MPCGTCHATCDCREERIAGPVAALEPFAWFADVIPSEYTEATKTFTLIQPVRREDGTTEFDRALLGQVFYNARAALKAYKGDES